MKRTLIIAVVTTLLSAGFARADGLEYTDPMLPAEQNLYVELTMTRQLSDFITNASRDFCPAPGMELHPAPPIGLDVFLRSGPSTPFGSGTLAQTLDTGWMIEGGARALLYNNAMDAAWVVEGSVSNTWNGANSSTRNSPSTINIPEGGVLTNQTVTIRELNQTFVNSGFGREWYLLGRYSSNHYLCVGFDVGGRLGTARMEFNEIGYRSGMIYGAYGAIHAELLFPLGGCYSLVLGVRGEYDLMQNNNILQTTETLQEASVLFNVGLRF